MTVVTRSNYYGKATRLSLLVTVAAGAMALAGSIGVTQRTAQEPAAPSQSVASVQGASGDLGSNGDWPWGPRPTVVAMGDQQANVTDVANGDWPWIRAK